MKRNFLSFWSRLVRLSREIGAVFLTEDGACTLIEERHQLNRDGSDPRVKNYLSPCPIQLPYSGKACGLRSQMKVTLRYLMTIRKYFLQYYGFWRACKYLRVAPNVSTWFLIFQPISPNNEWAFIIFWLIKNWLWGKKKLILVFLLF